MSLWPDEIGRPLI